MNHNLTDITVLLDRSGSMADCMGDVIGGYNTFVDRQRDADGDAKLTLIQFDSENPHEIFYVARTIQKVPRLTDKTFVPRGSTPLYDAVARAILATGRRLRDMAEESRPGKVVFIITTDGYENTSREYDKFAIKEMIKHQEERYSWDFIFMGADIDAMAQGGMIGLNAGNTVRMRKANFAQGFAATTENLATYRITGQKVDLNYSQAQRDILDTVTPDTTAGGDK